MEIQSSLESENSRTQWSFEPDGRRIMIKQKPQTGPKIVQTRVKGVPNG